MNFINFSGNQLCYEFKNIELKTELIFNTTE